MLEWAELGRAIEQARGRRELTQQELAELVEVSVKTINNLENGRSRGMRAKTQSRLQDALGWPEGHVHRLLTGQVIATTPAQPADPPKVDWSKYLEAESVRPVSEDAAFVTDRGQEDLPPGISDEELAERIRIGLLAMDEMRRRHGGSLDGPE